MIIREHKKVSTTVIYNENFLILAPTIIGCVSVSDFCFLVGTPVLITSSAIKLNTFSKVTKYYLPLVEIKDYNGVKIDKTFSINQ